MLVQMAVLQRFSIYLGHPTYTLSITLFSMILFAGLGSGALGPCRAGTAATRACAAARRRRRPAAAPGALRPVTQATIGSGLIARSAVVVALLAPLSMLLGCFFPTGLRLVNRLSPEATAWMWGVNGAFSVLGSIVAVAISIFVGIHANLLAAARSMRRWSCR